MKEAQKTSRMMKTGKASRRHHRLVPMDRRRRAGAAAGRDARGGRGRGLAVAEGGGRGRGLVRAEGGGHGRGLVRAGGGGHGRGLAHAGGGGHGRGLVHAEGGGRGRGLAHAGGGGHGRGLFHAEGRGRGRGLQQQQVDVGEEDRDEHLPENVGEADPRQQTEREAARPWLVGNENHTKRPVKGLICEREGVLLQLPLLEFKEIVFKRKYHSKNKDVYLANEELVGLYRDIQSHRLRSFRARKSGASKQQLIELKASFEQKLEEAKLLKGRIKGLKGKHVPMPPHFGDRKVIFG